MSCKNLLFVFADQWRRMAMGCAVLHRRHKQLASLLAPPRQPVYRTVASKYGDVYQL